MRGGMESSEMRVQLLMHARQLLSGPQVINGQVSMTSSVGALAGTIWLRIKPDANNQGRTYVSSLVSFARRSVRMESHICSTLQSQRIRASRADEARRSMCSCNRKQFNCRSLSFQ